MALTPAEKQRRYRDRKREEAKNSPDSTRPYLAVPFHKWMGNSDSAYWQEVEFPLGVSGLKFEAFTDDSGSADIARPYDEWGANEGYYDHFTGSVGRAEHMVWNLIEAGTALARRLNQYKLEHIDAELARLEKADLRDPSERKKAVAEMVKLNKLRDRLKKEKRFAMPEWMANDQ